MRRPALLLAFALLGALAASQAYADGEGTVEGRVINGTRDGGSVAGLEVTLNAAVGDAAPLVAPTDAEGQFRFEALSAAGDGPYTLAVRYQGVDYTAGGIEISADNPSRQAELTVYETTTSTETVKVLLDHHIVEASPQEHRLNIVNYIQLANAGDRTVVAPQANPGQPPLFPLPEAAEKVELLDGSSQHASGGSTGLSLRSIPPGEHELVLAYELPYEGDSFVFRKPVNYPTEKAVFLLSAHDGRAVSQQLPAVKEVESAAGMYRLLTGENPPVGGVLEVTITDMLTESGNPLVDILRPAAAVLVLLAIGAVVVYVRFRRRRVLPSPQGDGNA